MTSYQEHIEIKSNKREYELVMLVNGWSNLSLSGNITHAYNDAGEMYTVHYMSCLGEEVQMGWVDGKDYVLFTAIVMPVPNLLQKFHLYESYSVDYPSGYNYFYGLKGS